MALQLAFGDDLFREVEAADRRRRLDRELAHLPGEMEAAVRLHRQQIKQHDAAMRVPDLAAAELINREAHLMAVRVNHGEAGILASRDSPGSVLATRCAARAGRVPLWGQAGRFTITVAGVPVLIAMDGMFGICGGSIPGFSANAVDRARPFISPTGYRSFLGAHIVLVPGMSPGDYAQQTVDAAVADLPKAKLVAIGEKYRHG